MEQELYTISKLGSFEGDIFPLLKRYNPKFESIPNLRKSEIATYIVIDIILGDYVTIFVGQNLLAFTEEKPSISIAIQSRDEEHGKKVMQDLEEKLKLDLKDIPEEFKEVYRDINL